MPLACGVSLSHHPAIGLHGDVRQRRFRAGFPRSTAASAIQSFPGCTWREVFAQAAGKVSVALDFRDVPPEQVGTRTYAVNPRSAAALREEVELTLLVRDPSQARGLAGRVVTADRWVDDVALIHKPAQVIDPSELESCCLNHRPTW